jgi:hypothetical protein
LEEIPVPLAFVLIDTDKNAIEGAQKKLTLIPNVREA